MARSKKGGLPCQSREDRLKKGTCTPSGGWEGDGRDRFSAEELQRYHPFGPSFILCLHHIMNFGYYKGHKIDTFDERKAIRHPMTIEYLTVRSGG